MKRGRLAPAMRKVQGIAVDATFRPAIETSHGSPTRSHRMRWLPWPCLALVLAGCAGTVNPDAARQARVVNDPAAMLRIADATRDGGDNAGAMAFYRRAADLDPASSRAQLGVARALAEQGRTVDAVAALRAAHARLPAETDITGALGRLLVADHRPAEALVVFGEGVRSTPRSTPLLIGQGVALDTLSRHKEAQASYEEALRIDPASLPARKDLQLSQAASTPRPAAPVQLARRKPPLLRLRSSMAE